MRKIGIWMMAIALFAIPTEGFSFCGFYVAKADVKLFNKGSEVILVRDGNKTVVTMSNDFQGDVADFAMVVPVPTVLKESEIVIGDRYIFDKLEAYSGPRLVEYYDQNPCYQYELYDRAIPSSVKTAVPMMDIELEEEVADDLGVTIEASYSVGEYDILILSAEESGGLKTWLTKNNYQIPEGAEEVLDPYIKSDLKFFVAKVNLDKVADSQTTYLNPIQITYESSKFMLPIRLGMANAIDKQDLIVYAFTKTGRVETTNYRTVEIPTNQNIPTFVKDQFGPFYADLYEKAYKRNGRNAVFLEYSWDLSSSNFTKCDPCATTPPSYAELNDAGVFWVGSQFSNWGGSDYEGDVFMTRLHVTYDREHYPQDLQFQITPNKANFQGRYVMNHPVQGALNCEEASKYYLEVLDRRENEIDNLAYLTGWDMEEYGYYTKSYETKYNRSKKFNSDKGYMLPFIHSTGGGNGNGPLGIGLLSFAALGLLAIVAYRKKRVAIATS